RPAQSTLLPYPTLFRSAKNRRIHREEAHHPIHERPEHARVEKARPHREHDAVREPTPNELRDDDVQVEEAPVVRDEDEALPGIRSEEHTSELQSRENLV